MKMSDPKYWQGLVRFSLGLLSGFIPVIILIGASLLLGIKGFLLASILLSIWAKYDRQVLEEGRRNATPPQEGKK